MQKEIVLNGVNFPVIIEGKEVWYPISYMGSKVLLKDLTPSQLIKNGYDEYIKQFNIDYGEGIGGVQTTYCISEDGLKEILKNSRLGRLNVDQRKAMKEVCKYLGLDIKIDTKEKFIDSYPEDKWCKYDFWSVECIESVLKENQNIKWQKCSKCGRYYPYHRCFFGKESNPHNKNELKTVCNKCYKTTRILYYEDIELTNTYYNDGKSWYIFIKNNRSIYDIYDYYLKNNLKYPSILRNSLYVGNIITKYYKEEILNNLDIVDVNYISQISNIPTEYITIKMIDKNIIKSSKRKELLQEIKANKRLEDIKLKAVARELKQITYEDAVDIFNDYIKKYNIIIKDIYAYDYYKLVQKTKVKYYIKQNNIDTLEFIVKYYNWQYAPYKFKTVGSKFWRRKENIDKTLKYLIEQDMKLQLEKIPLYITKNNLQKKCRPLYTVLYEKRFDNSLFEWINRLYPSMFIEADFDIGIIRNKFDSIEEEIIDGLLRENFKSVVYNNRKGDNKVTIMGMNPDWFVFTDTNIYIIEYFGIALDHAKYNSRISNYIEKSEEKINKYRVLPYGKKVFIYPEDINGECIGFYKKIKSII